MPSRRRLLTRTGGVGRDTLRLQPAEKPAGPMSGIRGRAPWLEAKLFTASLDHDLRGHHFIKGPGRSYLDIDDDGVVVAD